MELKAYLNIYWFSRKLSFLVHFYRDNVKCRQTLTALPFQALISNDTKCKYTYTCCQNCILCTSTVLHYVDIAVRPLASEAST